jgi:hypothetical protein
MKEALFLVPLLPTNDNETKDLPPKLSERARRHVQDQTRLGERLSDQP